MFSQSYILGLIFIVLVALIWAASSVVAQIVYQTDSFDSPFLLTYIGTSLFTLWLPIYQLTASYFQLAPRITNGSESNVLLTQQHETAYHDAVGTGETLPNATDSHSVQQGSRTHHHPHAGVLVDVMEEAWNDNDHLRVAIRIAPVWFIANWSYNASLWYTSITSSTVLASTSSLFTFLFAVLVKDESFSLLKLGGVLLGVSGGILTALHDASERRRLFLLQEGNDDSDDDALALLGDFLGLVSAVGYGAYAVQTRVYCPKDESLYSMQLLLGYIGLLNMVLLSPIAIYVILSSGNLEWLIVGCVVLKGLFDNFLRYAPKRPFEIDIVKVWLEHVSRIVSSAQ